MIIVAIANTFSWVTAIQQPINDLISNKVPILESGVNWLAIISIWVFLCILIWTLADLNRRITKIEEVSPNLIWNHSGEWQFYPHGQPSYHATQIWFVNKPKTATGNSVAKNVSASMRFYNEDGKYLFEVFGYFTEAEVPDHATIQAITELKEQVELWPPDNIPRKLIVAYRYVGDENAYGFAKSNFIHASDGRDASRELSKGQYYVEVSFSGIGIDQPEYWFALVIPDKDGKILLSRPLKKSPIKKPKIYKEDLPKR